jgi:hypothetical protein
MTSVSWIVEVVLIALLAACLFYCWRLERKLTDLRKGENGLREAARELSESVTQAQAAVLSLRAAAQDAGRDLQARIDAARGASSELPAPTFPTSSGPATTAPPGARGSLTSQLNVTRRGLGGAG